MTVAALELGAAARMLREAVKDRSYRATPLGLEVARYIRWKRNEWGASPETIRDYEAILRNVALFFADLDLPDFCPPVGTERLRECWDHYWSDRSPRTRAKVRSVWIDFFEWAVRERGLHGNPARALARPKARETSKDLLGESLIERLLTANSDYEADWLALTLIVRYAMRRGGVANVRVKHFDEQRRILTVFTKGGRVHPLPIPDDVFWMRLAALRMQGLGPDSFLLYARDSRRRKVDLADAEEIVDLGGGRRQGYAWVTTRNHDLKKPLAGHSVHRWWYRCLEQANLVAPGAQAGLNMHRGRHTSITAMVRGTHNLKLAQLLAGHKDIRTTAGYADLDTADLEAALIRIYGLGDDA